MAREDACEGIAAPLIPEEDPAKKSPTRSSPFFALGHAHIFKNHDVAF
jgi:hypothetical protein